MTTSLLGYGGTAERRTLRDADISREAEILEAVIRRAASPVHLVGHSFGGAVALTVALRKRVPVRSLVVIEAPVPELLRHAGEHWHYRTFREMTDAYFDAFRAGKATAIETDDRFLWRRRDLRRLAGTRPRAMRSTRRR